jgi:Holliday junction resolvase RusA-like endonuclease
MFLISFFVPGDVQPGGSKRGFLHRHTGRIIITDDCKKNGEWKNIVATHARFAFQRKPLIGPLAVICNIYIKRPKNHFGTGKNAKTLKLTAPLFPIVKPDATKLWRSTEDALTGIIWGDDAQVVHQFITKRYCDDDFSIPGAHLTIKEVTTIE